MKTKDSLDLEQLGDSYEIVGELVGREDARSFIARRRSDGRDVLVNVATAPQGDQGNALSHLAADSKLLAGQGGDGIVPVVDGRWVGRDSFAVITERVSWPTLEELLTRRGEEFPYQRIAAVLRDVNAALEWARDHRVVHRAVSVDTVHVEPGTDRAMVSFVVRPLPRVDMPGAEDDAKTIAVLARTMLTRSTVAPERERQPLAELRPGLPKQIVEQTESMLKPERDAAVPDVSGYIASIAMAEALKEGEIQLEKTRHAIEEQQRQHREQIERERKEHNEQIAAERKAHQTEVEEQARAFQKEREQYERERTKEREQYERERTKERDQYERELSKERKALEREREALARERAAHAKDAERLATERAEHEREISELRERLEWESAALRTQLERYAIAELPTDVVMPQPRPKVPAVPVHVEPAARKKLAAADITPPPPAEEEEEDFVPSIIDAAPESRDEPKTPPVPAIATPLIAPTAPPPQTAFALQRAWKQRPRWRREWNIPAAAAALLLVVSVAVIAMRGGDDTPVQVAQTEQRVVDSAGGVSLPAGEAPAGRFSNGIPNDFIAAVGGRPVASETRAATPTAGVQAPPATASSAGVPADFMTGVASRAAEAPAPAPAPVRRRQVTTSRPDPLPTTPPPVSDPLPTTSGVTIDTVFGSSVRVDSVRRGGVTLPPPTPIRRDTLPQ